MEDENKQEPWRGRRGHTKKCRKDGGQQARDNEEKETAINLLFGVVFKEVL